MPKQMVCRELGEYINLDQSLAGLIKDLQTIETVHPGSRIKVEHDYDSWAVNIEVYELETDTQEKHREQRELEQKERSEAYDRKMYLALQKKYGGK